MRVYACKENVLLRRSGCTWEGRFKQTEPPRRKKGYLVLKLRHVQDSGGCVEMRVCTESGTSPAEGGDGEKTAGGCWRETVKGQGRGIRHHVPHALALARTRTLTILEARLAGQTCQPAACITHSK